MYGSTHYKGPRIGKFRQSTVEIARNGGRGRNGKLLFNENLKRFQKWILVMLAAL